jgi:fructose-specific phosphotransferase system IIC component
MIGRFTFGYRVVLLLGLMVIVAAIDRLRHREKATRFREYGFILLTGLIGVLAGFANDLVTSSISPDFFVLGKGLTPGEGLRWRAGFYGAQAGFAAGIVGGAVCLLASVKKSADLTGQLIRLVKVLWVPLAGAILLGAALPLLVRDADPAHLASKLETLLNPEQIERFRRVWWTHIGLYAGMLLGLMAIIFRHRCATKP